MESISVVFRRVPLAFPTSGGRVSVSMIRTRAVRRSLPTSTVMVSGSQTFGSSVLVLCLLSENPAMVAFSELWRRTLTSVSTGGFFSGSPTTRRSISLFGKNFLVRSARLKLTDDGSCSLRVSVSILSVLNLATEGSPIFLQAHSAALLRSFPRSLSLFAQKIQAPAQPSPHPVIYPPLPICSVRSFIGSGFCYSPSPTSAISLIHDYPPLLKLRLEATGVDLFSGSPRRTYTFILLKTASRPEDSDGPCSIFRTDLEKLSQIYALLAVIVGFTYRLHILSSGSCSLRLISTRRILGRTRIVSTGNCLSALSPPPFFCKPPANYSDQSCIDMAKGILLMGLGLFVSLVASTWSIYKTPGPSKILVCLLPWGLIYFFHRRNILINYIWVRSLPLSSYMERIVFLLIFYARNQDVIHSVLHVLDKIFMRLDYATRLFSTRSELFEFVVKFQEVWSGCYSFGAGLRFLIARVISRPTCDHPLQGKGASAFQMQVRTLKTLWNLSIPVRQSFPRRIVILLWLIVHPAGWCIFEMHLFIFSIFRHAYLLCISCFLTYCYFVRVSRFARNTSTRVSCSPHVRFLAFHSLLKRGFRLKT